MPRLPLTNPVDLDQLQSELTAAGIAVAGLGTAADELFTYDASGQPIDLPASATAVVQAHQPQPREVDVAKSDMRNQYQQAMTRLTAIVQDGSSFTAPQVRDAVVDMARIQRALLRLVKGVLT